LNKENPSSSRLKSELRRARWVVTTPALAGRGKNIKNVTGNRISLRKIKGSDKRYFAKWWRDKSLLKITSGELKRISDQEVSKYFTRISKDAKGKQYMITVSGEAIGHIALERRKNGWYEIQIVIGEKKQQNKGYGIKAIKQLLGKTQKEGINKIYLEVRPNNLRAIRAYEKCGFQNTGIKRYPNNLYLPKTIKMVLRT